MANGLQNRSRFPPRPLRAAATGHRPFFATARQADSVPGRQSLATAAAFSLPPADFSPALPTAAAARSRPIPARWRGRFYAPPGASDAALCRSDDRNCVGRCVPHPATPLCSAGTAPCARTVRQSPALPAARPRCRATLLHRAVARNRRTARRSAKCR